ncbi:MAG: hypothetical protein ABTQ25_10290, partial [Nitrosomonas ureae]
TPKPDDRILTNATHPFDPDLPDEFIILNGALLIIRLPVARTCCPADLRPEPLPAEWFADASPHKQPDFISERRRKAARSTRTSIPYILYLAQEQTEAVAFLYARFALSPTFARICCLLNYLNAVSEISTMARTCIRNAFSRLQNARH